MQQLADKYERFKQFIFTITENSANETICSLREASLTEFLASGQLLIAAQNIGDAHAFTSAVLSQTELTAIHDGLTVHDRATLFDYTAYFYEVIKIISRN